MITGQLRGVGNGEIQEESTQLMGEAMQKKCSYCSDPIYDFQDAVHIGCALLTSQTIEREDQGVTRPIAPGVILRRELLARHWSQRQLAEMMGRPYQAINEICQGKKQITAETALQLAGALSMSAALWMNLETRYRLRLAAERVS